MNTPRDQFVPPGADYVFGRFRYTSARRLLLCDQVAVPLGSRALAILEALLERPGEVVSKRDLMTIVWPGSVVEESNIKVNIAALRRALGDRGEHGPHIGTVNGRGYRFLAPVHCIVSTDRSDSASLLSIGPSCPLAIPGRVIGREHDVEAIQGLLVHRRFATLTGPGGVGKTTVARALANSLAAERGLHTCWIDLESLAGESFVRKAVVVALGLPSHCAEFMATLAEHLVKRRLLLVFDSCEHVLDTVGELAENITTSVPGIQVLCTSRESLRVTGETVYRLGPLEFPCCGDNLSVAQAMRYPSIELFVERASECYYGYRLRDADVAAVVEICRRLEGNALAIELAAMRIGAFGTRGIALYLGDRFQLLNRGRRGLHARHHTLRAALDWSYVFLPDGEQAILRAIACFAHPFALGDAIALCSGIDCDERTVIDGVASLVEKSLLLAMPSGSELRYHMLDTMRAYALEKLDASADATAVRRRYVELQDGLIGGHATAAFDRISDAQWRNDALNAITMHTALPWTNEDHGTHVPSAALR